MAPSGNADPLTTRCATSLPRLTNQVKALARRVDKHLEKMGLAWN